MMIQPKAATFSEKDTSYQVARNGYILFEFSPINETKQLDMTQKRNIVLTMKNVGDILDLDTRLPYDAQIDDDGTFMQY